MIDKRNPRLIYCTSTPAHPRTGSPTVTSKVVRIVDRVISYQTAPIACVELVRGMHSDNFVEPKPMERLLPLLCGTKTNKQRLETRVALVERLETRVVALLYEHYCTGSRKSQCGPRTTPTIIPVRPFASRSRYCIRQGRIDDHHA